MWDSDPTKVHAMLAQYKGKMSVFWSGPPQPRDEGDIVVFGGVVTTIVKGLEGGSGMSVIKKGGYTYLVGADQ